MSAGLLIDALDGVAGGFATTAVQDAVNVVLLLIVNGKLIIFPPTVQPLNVNPDLVGVPGF